MTTKKTDKAETNFDRAKEAWSATLNRQATHINSMCSEWERMEKKSTAQVMTAIDEFAKLTRATVDYTSDLNGQFRATAMDAMNTWSASNT